MSPYFPKHPVEASKYWCPNCKAAYRVVPSQVGMFCLVLHGAGDCCHFGEERVKPESTGTDEGRER